MSNPSSLGWGIIGPGSIAKAFADALPHSRTGRLVAIATRDPGRPGLAERFPGARIHAGYEAMLGDPEVEAIYIATPHPAHAEWAIKAAEAGKHVLCEKPIAVSAAEAEAMVAAARRAGTFLGEAFMYRLHPMTAKIVDLVKAQAMGELRLIRSSIGFNMTFDPASRLFANDTAGGAILDVGCYPVSMARLIAGAAAGKPFLDPVKVSGVAAFPRDRRGRLGRGDDGVSRRRHRRRRDLPRGGAGERAPHLRHRRLDRGEGLLVRERQAGRHRHDRDPPQGPRAGDHHGRRSRAGSMPSRSTPPATRSAPAARSSTRRA